MKAEANEVDSEVESLIYMMRNRKLKMELKLLQKKNRILESQLLQSQMELQFQKDKVPDGAHLSNQPS